ncbi:hypothetical protein CN617_29645 [Bacillus wiedmannii]|nr:hypothetical protein CN617_29645 [Bacillus wiedmannii]
MYYYIALKKILSCYTVTPGFPGVLIYNSVFIKNDALIHLDTFTSIFTKIFMIWLFSRVRHYLTNTLRSLVDKRGFFYSNKNFV